MLPIPPVALHSKLLLALLIVIFAVGVCERLGVIRKVVHRIRWKSGKFNPPWSEALRSLAAGKGVDLDLAISRFGGERVVRDLTVKYEDAPSDGTRSIYLNELFDFFRSKTDRLDGSR